MKITKARLKEIIKEEMQKETLSPMDFSAGRDPAVSLGSSGLEPFPDLAATATPDTPGHDHFTALKTIYGAASMDEKLPKIFLTHISAAAKILADHLGSQE